jgi:hypothetical protein
VVLVALTLLGALPVYRRVAESPNGEGSIAMLERLMSFWKGKIFVLALLGFAATDFIITMTLSAADATAHLVENPHLEPFLAGHQVAVTLFPLALLGAVFLRGFKEAVGVAVALVAVYLALNIVVITVASDRWRLSRSSGQSGPPPLPSSTEPAGNRRHRAAGLSKAGAWPLRLRDWCSGDATHQRRPGRHACSSNGSYPWRQEAADHGRIDHERFLDNEQCGHHVAHPAGGVPTRRIGERAGPGVSGP